MGPIREGPRAKRVACPILSACWILNNFIALGGGGGKSKSGVPNRVTFCQYDNVLNVCRTHVDQDDASVAVACLASPSGAVLLSALDDGGVNVINVSRSGSEVKASISDSQGAASGSREDPLHATQIGYVSVMRSSPTLRFVAVGHMVDYEGKQGAVAGTVGPSEPTGERYITVLDSELCVVSKIGGLLTGDAKDMDFCPHPALGKDSEAVLAVLDDEGVCNVVDWRTGGQIKAPVALEGTPLQGGSIRRLRFSRASDVPVLFLLVVHSRKSYVARFDVERSKGKKAITLSYRSSSLVVSDVATSFDLGRGRDVLAVGTGEGEVMVFSDASSSSPVCLLRKRQHMGIITCCAFSTDDGAVMTTDIGAFCVCTPVPVAASKLRGPSLLLSVLVALLALLSGVYRDRLGLPSAWTTTGDTTSGVGGEPTMVATDTPGPGVIPDGTPTPAPASTPMATQAPSPTPMPSPTPGSTPAPTPEADVSAENSSPAQGSTPEVSQGATGSPTDTPRDGPTAGAESAADAASGSSGGDTTEKESTQGDVGTISDVAPEGTETPTSGTEAGSTEAGAAEA